MKSSKKTNIFFLIHLNELKINLLFLIFCFINTFTISYFFSNQILYLFIKSILNSNIINYFILTDLTEAFIIKIYLSVFFSLLITLPFLIIQIWFFLIPGFYIKENLQIFKNYIYLYIFFIFNNLYICYIFIPNIWDFFFFFMDFNQKFLLNIYFEPKLYNYIFLLFKIIIYYNFLSLLPFIFIYIYFKIIFKKNYIYLYRKIIYLLILIISIIISPPDFFSQFLISLPLFLCFEFLYFFLLLKKKYKKINL